MAQRNDRVLWGLFFLRLGLGIFFVLWGLDKILFPATTIEVFRDLYLVNIPWWAAPIIGGGEIILGLAIVVGFYKRFTYGLALFIHTLSTFARYELLLMPFGPNHSIIATLPVLCAFLALFLCRNFDTKFTVQRKKSIFFERK